MKPRKVRACVITGFGINADEELALAFEHSGARAERTHLNELIREPGLLASCDILAFPGGFSFGDHLGSGKVLAHIVKRSLRPGITSLVERGGLVIGICNGFQVLVKMGLLPNLEGDWEQEVSLIHNESGRFEDRWVRVAFEGNHCAWTRGLPAMDLPVRHGEGRFVAKAPDVLDALESRGLVALRYAAPGGGAAAYPANPNGSERGIAGICDPSGRIFGLMPHPEAFAYAENHPEWMRGKAREGEGLALFRAGVAAAGEHLR